MSSLQEPEAGRLGRTPGPLRRSPLRRWYHDQYDPVKYIYELVYRAFLKFGMDVTVPKAPEHMLRKAGFENVQCIVKKVPIGAWARDKTLRVVCMYQEMAVQDLLPAFAGWPFTALGMSQVENQVALAHARQGLGDTRVHLECAEAIDVRAEGFRIQEDAVVRMMSVMHSGSISIF